MYTKLEIFAIYNNIQSIDDFEKVNDCFHWLIENEFIEKSTYLYAISQLTFRKLYKC